jgi:hypothetical protein
MIAERLMTQAASLAARTQDGPADEYGSPTWRTTLTAITPGVLFQPRTSEELAAVAGLTQWQGFLPSGLVVDTADGVLMGDGRWFELSGPPRPHTNPRTGVVSHIEVDADLMDRPEWVEESS